MAWDSVNQRLMVYGAQLYSGNSRLRERLYAFDPSDLSFTQIGGDIFDGILRTVDNGMAFNPADGNLILSRRDVLSPPTGTQLYLLNPLTGALTTIVDTIPTPTGLTGTLQIYALTYDFNNLVLYAAEVHNRVFGRG